MNKPDKTLQYYIDNAEEYAIQTADADMGSAMGVFLKRVPAKGTILDLGCGCGRDSKSFHEMGYAVTAIDGSLELCNIASKNTGLPVRCLLFQELEYFHVFEGIWACSSLHHLSRNQLNETLPKVIRALKPGGVLYTCFKYGENDYDDEKGRHFTCETEQSVNGIFEVVRHDIEINNMNIWITGDNLGGRDLRWVNVIVSSKRDNCIK